MHGQDAYTPEEIDYALAFRPPPGLLASLPKLNIVFSLGAGIDGFLADPSYPRHVPLVRFVDKTLADEMAQYAVLHTLMFHRNQRALDAAQANGEWLRVLLDRATRRYADRNSRAGRDRARLRSRTSSARLSGVRLEPHAEDHRRRQKPCRRRRARTHFWRRATF